MFLMKGAAVSNFLLITFYAAVSVAGLTLIKAAPAMVSTISAIGFSLYALGFLLWYVILKILPLSVAFPIAAGMLMIGTQASGAFYLRESVSLTRLMGVAVVVIGMVLIGISASTGNK